MSDMDRPGTIDDVRAAAQRLRGIALATPLVPFTRPDSRPILPKAESLQPIGAFKIRGAYNAIASLDFWSVLAASSRHRAATMARAWLVPRACSGSRRRSSCRPTQRR